MTTSADTTLVCPSCGATAAPGDRFCEACGADLPVVGAPVPTTAEGLAACPSCGADTTDAADGYCPMCGIKLPAARDHMEVTLDGVAVVTDRGRVHHRNEDAFAVLADDEVRVVVCDGVSSTVMPDVASQAAADAALRVLSTDSRPAALRLVDAYEAARDAVTALDATPTPDLGPPSCTFLGCVVAADIVELATMGDCRAYWLPSAGEPQVLTEDDSWAAEQVAAGLLSEDEALTHPMAHTITRWLGPDADRSWRPRLLQFTASTDGRLVLCSDGLWNYAVRAADIKAVAGDGDTAVVAQRLAEYANEQGGHDNITVAVIDVPYGGGWKGQHP